MESMYACLSRSWLISQCLCYLISSKLPRYLTLLDFLYALSLVLFTSDAVSRRNHEGTTDASFWSSCYYCFINFVPITCFLIVPTLRFVVINVIFSFRRSKTLWVEVIATALLILSVVLTTISLSRQAVASAGVWLISAQIFIVAFEFLSILLNEERIRKRAAIWRDLTFGRRHSYSRFDTTTAPVITVRSEGASGIVAIWKQLKLLKSHNTQQTTVSDVALNAPNYSGIATHEAGVGQEELPSSTSREDSRVQRDPSALKDIGDFQADKKYITLENVFVHYRFKGERGHFFVCIHQFGASTFTWRNIQSKLSECGRVLSYDRIAHGFTSRPASNHSIVLPGYETEVNPYSEEFSIRVCLTLIGLLLKDYSIFTDTEDSKELYLHQQYEPIASTTEFSNTFSHHWMTSRSSAYTKKELSSSAVFVDKFDVRAPRVTTSEDKTYLIGCGSGCSIAVECAIRERNVSGLILISPSLYSEGFPAVLRSIFKTKVGRSLTLSIVKNELTNFRLKRSFHDQKKLLPSIVAGYGESLSVEGWEDGFFELFKHFKPLKVYERLDHLKVPVLLIAGQHDKLTPPGEMQRLCSDLNNNAVNM